ncbi:hypothetical protein CXG81DRAFT_25175 [Caulochytrium protostelioides]|uniref:Hydrophobin n=1 Tax=Caulochytrium protostelioides TaxID=1555241 RepID=A0A4P9XA18_9FUNG|nr:hypothetical protein CXG81DRAFT_25175 [Caulochytrium protostelioides]|eukprot:RKP02155.1 hypothetical protein CXG81DRAFT_25175 [Caulochytrium protostelioides]
MLSLSRLLHVVLAVAYAAWLAHALAAPDAASPPSPAPAAAAAPGVPAQQCAVGSKTYCCSDVASPDSSVEGVLSGILNNIHVGLTCSPIIIPILSTVTVDMCHTTVICCAGNVIYNGTAVMGCDASTKRVMGPAGAVRRLGPPPETLLAPAATR